MRFVGGVLRTVAIWSFLILVTTLLLVAALVGLDRIAWQHLANRWAQVSLWLAGIRIDLDGARHLTRTGVYVGNHQAVVDALIYPSLVPAKIKYVAKKEIIRVPFFGWAIGVTGGFLVDRSNTAAAIESIRSGLEKLPPDWSIFVAPEGTRSKDGKLGRFKKGAVHIATERKVPIIPLGVYWDPSLVPVGSPLPPPCTIYVTVGAPIDTSGWASGEASTSTEIVRAAVAECIRVSKQRATHSMDEDR